MGLYCFFFSILFSSFSVLKYHTPYMPRPSSFFLFSFTPSQSSQCSPQLLGRLWLGAAISGPAKRFGWFWTYQPPRFRWEKISRMPWGWFLNVPLGCKVKFRGLANNHELLPSITGACPGAKDRRRGHENLWEMDRLARKSWQSY